MSEMVKCAVRWAERGGMLECGAHDVEWAVRHGDLCPVRRAYLRAAEEVEGERTETSRNPALLRAAARLRDMAGEG